MGGGDVGEGGAELAPVAKFISITAFVAGLSVGPLEPVLDTGLGEGSKAVFETTLAELCAELAIPRVDEPAAGAVAEGALDTESCDELTSAGSVEAAGGAVADGTLDAEFCDELTSAGSVETAAGAVAEGLLDAELCNGFAFAGFVEVGPPAVWVSGTPLDEAAELAPSRRVTTSALHRY